MPLPALCPSVLVSLSESLFAQAFFYFLFHLSLCMSLPRFAYFGCTYNGKRSKREPDQQVQKMKFSASMQNGCNVCISRAAFIQAAYTTSALFCRTMPEGGEKEMIYICALDILIPSCTVSIERDTKSFRNVFLIIHLIKCSTLIPTMSTKHLSTPPPIPFLSCPF